MTTVGFAVLVFNSLSFREGTTMATRLNCSRCGCFASSDTGPPITCPGCHHRADVPPDQCDCPMCFAIILPPVPDELALILPPDFFGAPVREFAQVEHYSAMSRNSDTGMSLDAPGFHAPVFDTTTFADRIVICVECEQNPEAEITLTISAEMIGKWWRAMCQMEEREDDRGEDIQ